MHALRLLTLAAVIVLPVLARSAAAAAAPAVTIRAVAGDSPDGITLAYHSGDTRVARPPANAPAGVQLQRPGAAPEPVRFDSHTATGSELVLGPTRIGSLTLTWRVTQKNPSLIERTLEVTAAEPQRFTVAFPVEFEAAAAGEFASFTGPVSERATFDTVRGTAHTETFPVGLNRVGDRVFGLAADSPGLWENRAQVVVDPGARRLAILTGDARDPYRLVIQPPEDARDTYQYQMDGWQTLAAGETRRFTTWVFGSAARNHYDAQLAAHLAVAQAKGWGGSAVEAILRNTSLYLLRRNLALDAHQQPRDGRFIFISGPGYGWKQWVSDGFYTALGLDDPEKTIEANRAVFWNRMDYEDNAHYYLVWAVLMKRAGGTINEPLVRRAYEFIRTHERDGAYLPPSLPGAPNALGWKTYHDVLPYEEGDCPTSDQGFHCAALLAARELGLPATDADLDRAIAAYRALFNEGRGFFPTSRKQPDVLGQDTLYGATLAYAVFGRKLLTDEQVLTHHRTSARVATPFGLRVISQADGALLPGHSGEYCYGGSWFLNDAANYLLAGVHGLPAAEVDALLAERIAREIAHVPAFNESISTVTGRPHGHVLYSWNSGYWWLRREVRRRLGQSGPDPVDTAVDARLGVVRPDGVLRLDPAAADARAASPRSPLAPPFHAGAAVTDISPTNFPVRVNAMFTERTATQTVDRLHARALVLADGTHRIALAVVDSCMLPRDLIDRAKALASRATGIPVDRLLVSATHTHSAPSAMGCLGSRVDPLYAAYLPGRIADAIIAANRNLAPARVGWGVTNDWEHTFNRRWIRRPDRLLEDPFGQRSVRAHMHPGHESPDVTGPSGPVDPGLSVLAVRTLDGQPLAVLANYSQHYYGSPLLSSDYYGRFADHLARLLAGPAATNSARPFVALLSQGTSGDQMWMDYAAPRREIGYDAYARELAEVAAGLCRGLTYHDHAPVRMAEARLELGYRVPDVARLAWARGVQASLGDRLPATQPEIYALEAVYLHERPRTELVLQALRIGDLGIAAIPNEVFALTGLKLKSRSPFPTTFTLELANGAEGYIPPPEQHALGGYTTWPARTAGLEVQAEPRIVETALALLERVADRPRRDPSPAAGEYTRAVLADRPLAYWRLDEQTAPVAHDATGHGHAAHMESGVALYLPGVGSGEGVSPRPALTPSAFSGPGEINRSVHLAGGRLAAELPALGSQHTLEFWFWNGLTNSARPVTGVLASLSATDATTSPAVHLGIGGSLSEATQGRLFFADGDPLHPPVAGTTVLGFRRWHRVALVRDGPAVTVYLDERPEPEIRTTAAALPNGPVKFLLGGRPDGFANFEGRLDEVAVYDRALTPETLAAHLRAAALAPASTTPTPGSAAAAKPSGPPPRPLTAPVSPEDSLAKIHVPDGFRVELVAGEPLVVDPVAIDWDEDGRLWVVEMPDYPLGMDGNGKPGGRVRVLEDTDGDGRYDRSTLFADGLNFPNGILAGHDGVLVTAAPDVLLLRDTDGDGRADVKKVLLSGFLEGNQQLRVNGLRWGLDNWVYCAAGGHHRGHGAGTVVHSALTGYDIALGSRDFRFRPDTGEFDPQSGPTQFGRNRDDWGHWFGTQNSWPLWHYVLPDPYLRRNPHIPAPDPVRQVIRPMNPKVFPASTQEKRYHSFNEAGHFTSACSGMVHRDDLLFGPDGGLHAFACEPFHNLVHHEILRDDGVSFSAARAPGEETREFFASEDRWCRPVMVRTGPDGALWVVDMYRYMIEHPQWLPPEGRAELLPHYRLGDDRGRLYRILPAKAAARPIPRLRTLDTAGLVAQLGSPNGWIRDKAQQLLVGRGDRTAVPPLGELARDPQRPLGRLHALCTLDGLGALAPELVARALGDSVAGIRENALRLGEARGTPAVVEAAGRLADDADPKVRLQLAFSLGAWPDPQAGATLARLAIRAAEADDTFLLAAVFSSALPHAAALVEAARDASPGVSAALVPPLLQLGLALDRRELLARLLEPALLPVDGRYQARQMETFTRFVDLLAGAGRTPAQLAAAGPDDALGRLLERRVALVAAAAALVESDRTEPGDSIRAATLLTRDPAHREAGLRALADWLQSRWPLDFQRAALAALGSTGAAEAGEYVLRAWPGIGPDLRLAAIDQLSSRDPWALALLRAVADQRVNRQAFDANRRARLFRSSNLALRRETTNAFEAISGPTNRAAVIEAFRPALGLAGDPARGAIVFDRLCLNCHQRGDRGHQVGPDLRSVANHPPEKLLVSILAPSADIQPGFHAYHCALRHGEELYGVIAAETGNSVVLALPDGTRRTVLRSDIAELRGSELSLMPEGLEAGLEPRDLADLIALLRAP